MGRILVADDHDALRRGLARRLAEAGHEVEEASNGNMAIERLHDSYFDVVLSDLKMGGSDGMDVLRTAKALHPTSAVILMTAFGSVHTAVEAMKFGAFDYVQKPFEIEEMELKVEKALEHRRLKHEIEYLRHTQGDIYDFDRIVDVPLRVPQVLDLVLEAAVLEGLLDLELHLLDLERLLHVVEGAELHRLDRRVDGAECRHQDDRRRRMQRAGRAEHVH